MNKVALGHFRWPRTNIPVMVDPTYGSVIEMDLKVATAATLKEVEEAFDRTYISQWPQEFREQVMNMMILRNDGNNAPTQIFTNSVFAFFCCCCSEAVQPTPSGVVSVGTFAAELRNFTSHKLQIRTENVLSERLFFSNSTICY